MAEIIEHVYFHGTEKSIKDLIGEYSDSGDLALVCEEDGCMQFEFYYSAADANKAILVERWRDQAALDAHHATAMMKTLRDLIKKHEINLNAEVFKA